MVLESFGQQLTCRLLNPRGTEPLAIQRNGDGHAVDGRNRVEGAVHEGTAAGTSISAARRHVRENRTL